MIFNLSTQSGTDIIDVTATVQNIVSTSGIKNGVCYVYVPHTTAAIMVNEHADPSVAADIKAQLELMVPQHSGYTHGEGNSPAHIKSALIGNSQSIFIEEGKLALGIWQGVFFCEFDGPRNRTVMVKIIPG